MDLAVSHSEAQAVPQKRNRVLLSCAPCRNSKLKCDRGDPCSQCEKKQRPGACVYAPKPIKKKPPPKGMSARLKRLEGMVRNIMDVEGNEELMKHILAGSESEDRNGASKTPKGHVVQSGSVPTYVGATHCMAMLEDIEDMKAYFDEDGNEDEGALPSDELDGAEMLLQTSNAPGDRHELLAQLPEKHVIDRLIMRYFASSSPSQHVIHKPMFTRNYAKFCQDPESVSLHWIAQLFMVVALGLVFNHFTAPHELEADSSVPAMDQIRNFRSCAAWALTWGKYTQPTHETLPAFILYVEAFFLFNRAAQMNCYILSGVCVRLMLKMGLHRDPSKLLNISAFEGEMRRRYWYMAVQVELLVSFHMGLPSIMAGIESDTEFPKNYKDDDFDEDMKQMPQERSLMDHTHMTYPIIKTKLMTVFGKIARQAHALTPPIYAETMRLDSMLNGVWDSVPAIVKFRPLEESVGDAPSLIIQRIGLASLYSKARCVLHRRYLAEPILKREHDYSRIQCLDAAVTLLHFQSTMWTATRPGNSLSEVGWFVSSLAVHDYMLAATIIYIVIKCEQYSDSGKDMEWAKTDKTLPSRTALIDMLRRSYEIWTQVSSSVTELRKTSDTLRVMLTKLGSPVPSPDASTNSPPDLISELSRSRGASTATSWNTGPTPVDVASSTGLGQQQHHQQPPLSFGLSDTDPLLSSVYATGDGLGDGLFDASQMDTAWMAVADEMDWRQIDIFGTNEAEMNLSMGDDGWAANASAWNIR